MDIDKLTLAELEAIAARLESAAKVFRDARALLSGGAAQAPTAPGAGVHAGPASAPSLSAVETQQRSRLLQQFPRDVLEAAGRG